MPIVLGLDTAGLEPKVADVIDSLSAALQTWTGKADGVGRWTHQPMTADMMQVDGAGNHWTTPIYGGGDLAWTRIGNTLIVNFGAVNSVLTIATAVASVQVKIPGEFKALYNPFNFAFGSGWILNGGTIYAAETAVFSANYITIRRSPFVNLVDDSGGTFSAIGSLTFEIIPPT